MNIYDLLTNKYISHRYVHIYRYMNTCVYIYIQTYIWPPSTSLSQLVRGSDGAGRKHHGVGVRGQTIAGDSNLVGGLEHEFIFP